MDTKMQAVLDETLMVMTVLKPTRPTLGRFFCVRQGSRERWSKQSLWRLAGFHGHD